jgi:hypothetical protein
MEVTAAVPLLNTETSSRGDVIAPREMMAITKHRRDVGLSTLRLVGRRLHVDGALEILAEPTLHLLGERGVRDEHAIVVVLARWRLTLSRGVGVRGYSPRTLTSENNLAFALDVRSPS